MNQLKVDDMKSDSKSRKSSKTNLNEVESVDGKNKSEKTEMLTLPMETLPRRKSEVNVSQMDKQTTINESSTSHSNLVKVENEKTGKSDSLKNLVNKIENVKEAISSSVKNLLDHKKSQSDTTGSKDDLRNASKKTEKEIVSQPTPEVAIAPKVEEAVKDKPIESTQPDSLLIQVQRKKIAKPKSSQATASSVLTQQSNYFYQSATASEEHVSNKELESTSKPKLPFGVPAGGMPMMGMPLGGFKPSDMKKKSVDEVKKEEIKPTELKKEKSELNLSPTNSNAKPRRLSAATLNFPDEKPMENTVVVEKSVEKEPEKPIEPTLIPDLENSGSEEGFFKNLKRRLSKSGSITEVKIVEPKQEPAAVGIGARRASENNPLLNKIRSRSSSAAKNEPVEVKPEIIEAPKPTPTVNSVSTTAKSWIKKDEKKEEPKNSFLPKESVVDKLKDKVEKPIEKSQTAEAKSEVKSEKPKESLPTGKLASSFLQRKESEPVLPPIKGSFSGKKEDKPVIPSPTADKPISSPTRVSFSIKKEESKPQPPKEAEKSGVAPWQAELQKRKNFTQNKS